MLNFCLRWRLFESNFYALYITYFTYTNLDPKMLFSLKELSLLLCVALVL